MVALLRPNGASFTAGSAPVVGARRPPLRLVVDNTASPSSSGAAGSTADRSLVVVAVVVALVVFGGLFGLRAAQGSPADTLGQPGAVVGAVVAGPGDGVVTAQQGDTMWSIAQSLSPDSDPRPGVAALIEANGGDSVRIGQQIVIPRHLLD